jgi:hypothetical protein
MLALPRESLLKGKAQYSLPPCTNELRSAGFDLANFYLTKTSYLNVEVNCAEPSPELVKGEVSLYH